MKNRIGRKLMSVKKKKIKKYLKVKLFDESEE